LGPDISGIRFAEGVEQRENFKTKTTVAFLSWRVSSLKRSLS
jgi:hypothetical protein